MVTQMLFCDRCVLVRAKQSRFFDVFAFVWYILLNHTNTNTDHFDKEHDSMKATGIVRRIDDLGRVVIPKEIRRTLRIREGDPSQITLTEEHSFIMAIKDIAERLHIGG